MTVRGGKLKVRTLVPLEVSLYPSPKTGEQKTEEYNRNQF